jgi:hypothetical protein
VNGAEAVNAIILMLSVSWEAISRWPKALFEMLDGLFDLLDGLSAIGDVLCVLVHVAGAILQLLELFAGFL